MIYTFILKDENYAINLRLYLEYIRDILVYWSLTLQNLGAKCIDICQGHVLKKCT